ncbi:MULTISPECIES: HK97 gp10 family phage protein [unclassified Curtobacterium]|uniref:HK97 gp10 family phage protein n=1 Tax=unclassified Curtobacterium TaxID=257496 RepID=UPI00082713A1|nr:MULTISPECIES: HK97 gp10 family phage protein [unclassified Curtobacterium]WIA99744.1 HK97 gp10 family phage protein [Curtobacterium sp. MCBA15_012]
MSIEWEDSFDWDGLQARKAAAVTPAVAAGMEVVRQVVTPKVPVEMGHLVGSPSVTAVGHEATIRYGGPYARYQEFGVYYRWGMRGAPLKHTHGQSFYLTTGIVEARDPALRACARVFEERL